MRHLLAIFDLRLKMRQFALVEILMLNGKGKNRSKATHGTVRETTNLTTRIISDSKEDGTAIMDGVDQEVMMVGEDQEAMMDGEMMQYHYFLNMKIKNGESQFFDMIL